MSRPRPEICRAESESIRFVPLAEEHIDPIMAIEHEAYAEPWTRSMFYEELRNDLSYFYVAFRGDEIIGYAGFWLVLDEAHITTVVVKRPYRGRGVGRMLMQYLIDKACEVGARIATLEVRVSNEHAIHLYQSMGFHAVGIRKGYYPRTGEDAQVMLLKL